MVLHFQKVRGRKRETVREIKQNMLQKLYQSLQSLKYYLALYKNSLLTPVIDDATQPKGGSNGGAIRTQIVCNLERQTLLLSW